MFLLLPRTPCIPCYYYYYYYIQAAPKNIITHKIDYCAGFFFFPPLRSSLHVHVYTHNARCSLMRACVRAYTCAVCGKNKERRTDAMCTVNGRRGSGPKDPSRQIDRTRTHERWRWLRRRRLIMAVAAREKGRRLYFVYRYNIIMRTRRRSEYF